MAFEELDLNLPGDFDGVVRLFPLPSLVLFPGVLQGLHLFEPRYLELLKDASREDNLITMALSHRERFDDPLGEIPTLHTGVCIGKIVTQAELDDGRFNILLVGVQRARIVSEISTTHPYRMANVELISSTCEGTETEVSQIRERLLKRFSEFAKMENLAHKTVRQIATEQLPFELFLDLICYATAGPVEQQQAVLECSDLIARARKVMKILDHRIRSTVSPSDSENGDRGFPPAFSLN